MNQIELKEFLDYKANKYESVDFIDTDPIKIPHQFSQKEDIEISGFLVASIAWGNRLSVLNSATKMMNMMEGSPYDFIINHNKSDLKVFEGFVHRTFNETDLNFFVRSLKNIYKNHHGLENVFILTACPSDILTILIVFEFFVRISVSTFCQQFDAV